ncbi:MAG: phage portal protein [Firmicutes bacterium]|nr:phage portal protein [Bacillota bacterium]
MNLEAFLNPVEPENIRFVASKRFLDKDGKPVVWELKPVSTEEDEALRKQCTKKVPVSGKFGQFTMETDYDLYLGKLAAKCTVSPDLDDSEFQDSFKVMGSDKLLKALLRPGEYAFYLKKVQEINGFDVGTEETVEQAKN